MQLKLHFISGAEIQKKWKNLKDCFQREMAAQRNTTSGQGAKKRRRYVHFDELLFLVPFIKGRETSCSIASNENDVEQECFGASNNTKNVTSVDEWTTPVRPNKSRSSTKSYEAELLSILKSKQEDNEDKHFALMLVPMLGRLNDEQKHFAKVEILNVMRRAKYFRPQQPQPAYADPFQRPPSAPTLVQFAYGQTETENLNSHNTGSMRSFSNDFDVMSPSSASGSEVFDLSSF